MIAFSQLKNWISWTRKAPAREAAGKERRRNKRTIPERGSKVLVVDDSRTVRNFLQKMLRQGGFDTLEAADGQTGVTLALTHQPDLIIMDVVMPGMNGFQATRKLRRAPETRGIPIIIMSGNQEAIDNFWATKIGANDFMMKPFNRKEIFRRLEKVLYDNEIL